MLKPSSMESLVHVAKAPLDYVETFSESHEDGDCSEPPVEEEPISESHGDVETAAPEFPRDDAAEDDLEEEAKSARSQIIKYDGDFNDFVLIICVLGKLSNIELLAFVLLLASWSYHYSMCWVL